LRALYTEFAPKLADALARVVKLDREIKRAGEAPDGRELAMVEAAARGFTHLDGMNHLTLTRAMVLPDWRNPEKRIWPPYDGAPDPDEQRGTD
jgi:hypothetical protein